MAAASTDSGTGEAIGSSAASSPELPARTTERKREKEKGRKRERETGSQRESLHPCGGQSDGAAVFALTTGSDFSPLAVVFFLILVLHDFGVVGVCACVRVRLFFCCFLLFSCCFDNRRFVV